MWRRVSCEQPLNTSQSILRLSGSIVQWSGDLRVLEPHLQPKGNQVLIPEPGSVTVGSLVSLVATRTELETPVRILGRVIFSA